MACHMLIDSTSVALLQRTRYSRKEMTEAVDQLCAALQFKVKSGTRVLLKPNLLSGRSREHLACTHPSLVAAVAEWFVEQGALVTIGDSPAFGTAKGVMRSTGIEESLAGLPVELTNFDNSTPVRLAGGVEVNVANAALECDMLINLPRIKAHSQFYMTLAVKNYFGIVVGFQKPIWHLRYGACAEMSSHLVDLLAVLPDGMTFIDGVVVMHGTGPVSGQPFTLGLLGGSPNPVSLDTALLKVLRLDYNRSAIWQECAKRNLAGSDPDTLDFPLLRPAEFKADGFRAPSMLKPVSFNPLRMMASGCRRFAARLKESS